MVILSFLAGSISYHPAKAFSTISKMRGPLRHHNSAFHVGTQTFQRHLMQKYNSCQKHIKKNTVSMSTDATSFDDGKSPFYITTPIYYVNDVPHIGHAYTSTACDVIARFMRLSGRDVFFLSGTDEHGQKVEASAAKKGIDPQAFVDDVSVNFKDLLDLMNISNDYFVRTTDQQHKEAVQV